MKFNLEREILDCQWLCSKVRNNDYYAQNLYAALCNNEFQKKDVFTILAEEAWGCSWRHAGGIVADILAKGDYMDWYCSGMGAAFSLDQDEDNNHMTSKGYVNEGHVTDEIREDIAKLGWKILPIDSRGDS